MALRISLTNTGNTDQRITLFDSGGFGTTSFVSGKTSYNFTNREVNANEGSSSLLNQTIVKSQVFYSDLTKQTGGRAIDIQIFAFENGIEYLIAGGSIGVPFTNLTDFIEIVTSLLTTQIQEGQVTLTRPNAEIIFFEQFIDGVSYLGFNVYDIIGDNEDFYYDRIQISYPNPELPPQPYKYLVNYESLYPSIRLNTYPNPSLSSDGWHTIQCNNLTLSSEYYEFQVDDNVLPQIGLDSNNFFNLEVQLSETCVGNFVLQPSIGTSVTILGNTTAIQQFVDLGKLAPFRLRLSSNIGTPYNGQIQIRFTSPTSNSLVQGTIYTYFNQHNTGLSYLLGNPYVFNTSSVTGVGLNEILNSVTGNSYKVTSLYIWSPNPRQLTQPITYGITNANGNLQQTNLNVVIDPYAQNQVVYRTNDMDDFKIDNNSFIRFTLKAKSFVSIRFEFLKNSFDEIKLVQIGLGELLGMEDEVKEDIDKSLIDDFDTFYSQQ